MKFLEFRIEGKFNLKSVEKRGGNKWNITACNIAAEYTFVRISNLNLKYILDTHSIFLELRFNLPETYALRVRNNKYLS